MSEAKPTPGPWEFLPGAADGIMPVSGMIAHCYDPATRGYAGIATLSRPLRRTREGGYLPLGSPVANGHLLAAAPDLLAACEAFERWDADPHATEADATAMRIAIRAAIDKANTKGGHS